ncbi:tetratricopeptide repeat protein [Pseudoxanthomonas winnipegensis]|uniref:Cytochrome C biogenesis protein n=1 Tax=Pseudoxanthomonas winnipegensis TaxID=2480810 RepID=A0A4Q8LZX7_9GAMM|nr:cytochrome C biogenesis protein [Pseudoxanthomonas winnipegensis]RZZ90540.1 cytochrome C biogenesis protein [Pseudoxanthomonas winnipegensis]TAA37304.1 cytochrome C biogenesis protein [Pseudoxanthomonas winnipegensis]
MTGFVIAAAVLTLLVLGGALWPLWRGAPKLAVGLVVALGVCAFALYRLLGTPAALAPQASQAPTTMEDAIVLLKEQLRRDPQAAEGWQLLGRTLAAQGKAVEAREAFARAVALLPEDANALVEAAQSRSLADPQRRLDDQAVAMLEHALRIDPTQQRARWFLGVAQRQRGAAAQAAATWEPLLAQVDTATANSLREQINAARAEAGQPPLTAPTSAPAAADEANAVRVRVTLDPALPAAARPPADATVFVIARMPDGPPMPVAVQKHTLGQLPLEIRLSDADSPMPTQKLSALREVELIARVSASGNAQRSAGDLESAPVRVRLPAQAPVTLVIGSGAR